MKKKIKSDPKKSLLLGMLKGEQIIYEGIIHNELTKVP